MQRQIPLVANTASGDISGQELLVNMYPRKSVGGKYPFTLIGTPGKAYYLELPTFPLAALHHINERAFAITPTKLYEIFTNGTYTELGDVSMNGIVKTEDNGLQLVMVNGLNAYSFDLSTGIVSDLSTIDGFYPSSSVTYQDGYFIFVRDSTGQYFISDLLSVQFDPLNFSTAEAQPDILVSSLSDHREVFLFGTETIQIVYNSGDTDFPFEINQGAFIEKGCGAKHTIVKQNNTIYFVGSDLMVYQMSGYTPIRISSNPVEDDLKGVDLSNAFAYTYQDGGALFYVLTIPSRNKTWCLDISTGAWHIRQSYQFKRDQISCSMFFDSKTLVGDFQNGRIYQLTRDYFTDDGEPIIREFVLPVVNNGREFLTVDSLEFDMNTGVGTISGDGENPKLRVFTSKDNGNNYGQNFKTGYIGKMGKYNSRPKVTRFGAARQFTFKGQISAPVRVEIGGAWVEIR